MYYSPIDKYRKPFMMKPEIKYFPALISWDEFQEWHDQVIAVAGGTGLHNHMNFLYDPPKDEADWFLGMDRWFYVILNV